MSFNDLADSCSGTRIDAQWATEKKEEIGRILAVYAKTEWFWVALVLIELIAQGLKTARSTPAMLDLLSKLYNGH